MTGGRNLDQDFRNNIDDIAFGFHGIHEQITTRVINEHGQISASCERADTHGSTSIEMDQFSTCRRSPRRAWNRETGLFP